MPRHFVKYPPHDQPAAKIYTSGNVNMFEECFRALLESPKMLLLHATTVRQQDVKGSKLSNVYRAMQDT